MDIANTSYLMFRHSDSLYGVEAHRVREIFQLPELTPIADAPRDVIGSLNWRGKLLPMMHLDLRLGHPLQPCRISDSVIVLDWQGLQVGLVVQQVLDVQPVVTTEQDAMLDYGRDQQINTAFVAGVVSVGDDLAVLLNPETLIRQADEVATLIWESELTEQDSELQWQEQATTDQGGMSFYELYCGPVSAAEQAIFQQRAAELRVRLEESSVADQVPLAVIGLGGTNFALDLNLVREFINVQQVTPIPCCPPHIVGNMNLRGEILTLVDVSTVLNQTAAPTQKAIVVEVDDIVAGIPIDAVLDVIYLAPTDMTEVPIAVSQQSYLQGMAQYRGQHLSVLDLPALFATGGLVVNQDG